MFNVGLSDTAGRGSFPLVCKCSDVRLHRRRKALVLFAAFRHGGLFLLSLLAASFHKSEVSFLNKRLSSPPSMDH